MSKVLFTCPGQVGDDLFRFPIAYQYAKQNNATVDIVLSNESSSLKSLLQPEPWVDRVIISSGITGHPLGGQPWDFGRDAEWRSQYSEVYHLGYRRYPWPTKNNTVECFETSGVPIKFTNLLTEGCLTKHQFTKIETLALHIDATCEMRNTTCANTIFPVLSKLHDYFDKCFLLGTNFSRWQYQAIRGMFPGWASNVVDNGDWNVTARVLCKSLLIGTYSCMWALMTCIKGPQIIVMDQDFINRRSDSISDPRVEKIVMVSNSDHIIERTLELKNEW